MSKRKAWTVETCSETWHETWRGDQKRWILVACCAVQLSLRWWLARVSAESRAVLMLARPAGCCSETGGDGGCEHI